MKLLLLICFVVLVHPLMAQELMLSPLRSQGPIPPDFSILTSKKVKLDNEKISQKKRKKSKKIEKDFNNISNFGVDDILLSGKVLYGDVTAQYVNRIADHILKDDMALRNKLRFYVLKSNQVNAFSTQQGVIFVTIGLLCKIETEAQLAFILCHEVSHFTQKHNLNSYKQFRGLKDSSRHYSQSDFESRLSEIYKYSKLNEIEADSLGFQLYKRSKYELAHAKEALEMLARSERQYANYKWSLKQYEDSFYQFPSVYHRDPYERIPFVMEGAFDQESTTHPKLGLRIKKVSSYVAAAGGSSKVQKQENNALEIVQKQARSEQMHIYLNYGEYYKAIYASHIFTQLYGANPLTKMAEAYSIYSLALKGRVSDDFQIYITEKYLLYSDTISVSLNEFIFGKTLNQLNSLELAVLATKLSWRIYSENPENTFAKDLFQRSCYTAFYDTTITPIYFAKVKLAGDTFIDEIYKPISKPQNKVKEINSWLTNNPFSKKDSSLAPVLKKAIDINKYCKYALTKELNESNIREELDLAFSQFKAEEPTTMVYVRNNNHGIKHEKPAMLDSIVLINPSFEKTLVSKGRKKKYSMVSNEKDQLSLSKRYTDNADSCGMHTTSLNLSDRDSLSTSDLNYYSILNEWVTERIYNDLSSPLLFNRQYTDSFSKQTGSKYVMLSNISYTKTRRELDFDAVVIFTVLFPLLPIYIASVLKKDHNLAISALVLDLHNGEVRFVNNQNYAMKNKKDYIDAHLYELFLVMKGDHGN